MPPAKVERCEFELEANKQHCLTHRAVFNNFPDDYKEAVIEAVSEDLELTDDAIDGIRTQSSHDAIDYIASREVMTAKHALRQTLLHSILHFRCHQLAHVASTPADKTKVTDIMKDVLAWCALDYIPGKTADVVKQVFPEFQFPVTPPRKEVTERLPPWVDGAIVLNTTTPAVPQPVHKPARKPPTGTKAKAGSVAAAVRNRVAQRDLRCLLANQRTTARLPRALRLEQLVETRLNLSRCAVNFIRRRQIYC